MQDIPGLMRPVHANKTAATIIEANAFAVFCSGEWFLCVMGEIVAVFSTTAATRYVTHLSVEFGLGHRV